jgi:hypothetical protein
MSLSSDIEILTARNPARDQSFAVIAGQYDATPVPIEAPGTRIVRIFAARHSGRAQSEARARPLMPVSGRAPLLPLAVFWKTCRARAMNDAGISHKPAGDCPKAFDISSTLAPPIDITGKSPVHRPFRDR